MKSRDWLIKAKSTIGGSSAGAAVGVGRFKTPVALWREIIDARDGHVEELPPTDDMRRGNLLEPIARQLLSEKIGKEIKPHDQDNFVRDSDWPWAHALPDGWVGPSIVELKVPRPVTVVAVRRNGLFGDWIAQALHNMAVCNADKCYFGIVDPVSVVCEVFVVEHDFDSIREQMDGEAAFWRHVESKTPPPETALEAQGDAIDRGPVPKIETEDVRVAAQAVTRLSAMFDDLDAAYEDAKARLLELAAGQDAFEVPGIGRFYHRQSAGRKTFDVDRAQAEFPALKDARFWKQTKPSRPFKVVPARKELV